MTDASPRPYPLLSRGALPVHQSAATVRTFTWADLSPLVTLLQQLDGDTGKSPDDATERTRRLYRQPGLQPERDCFLAWDGREVVGTLFMWVEERVGRGILFGGVRKSYRGRGIGRLLLDTVVSHARELRYSVLHIETLRGAKEAESLVRSAGFLPVRTHWRMRRRGSRPTGVDVPAGYRLRMMGPEDVEGVTRLQNDAFDGSWGFCPNTVEEVRYRVFEISVRQPAEVLLLDREGALDAYCWTERSGPGKPGAIDMMGVHPRFRGQGLGKVITGAAVDHLLRAGASPLELTVERENGPATQVYRSLGFRVWRVSYWHELRLE